MTARAGGSVNVAAHVHALFHSQAPEFAVLQERLSERGAPYAHPHFRSREAARTAWPATE